MLQHSIQNLLNLKLNNIQFKNISDVRIIDSIVQSNYVSTSWCNNNGCLRVLGQVIFPINCPLGCQLRKITKVETSNLIEPSIKMNINSTLDINYSIELDAFTVVVSSGEYNHDVNGQVEVNEYLGEESGDQLKMFLLYYLMRNNVRALSSFSFSIDNSSLINLTHLVNNSIVRSHMDISKFNVIESEITVESGILNVTVLFVFRMNCKIDCQRTEINKLKNTTLIMLDPIGIMYNGNIHFYNVSLIDVISPIIPILTTENTMMPNAISTITTTISALVNVTDSIFEVNYKLEPSDLVLEGDFKEGPITANSTLNDLTDLMQTTVSSDSNITVMVFNATITIDHSNSTTNITSSGSINYILSLIVQYIYVITCDKCIQICNEAVYNIPHLYKIIQIRNASLIDISQPISIIYIKPIPTTTIVSSTDTVSMSTIQFSTTDSGDNDSSTMITSQITSDKSTDSTFVHMTTQPDSTVHSSTTSQHQTTDHTSTLHQSTEHTSTLYHTSVHTTTHPYTSSHATTSKEN